MAAIAPTRLRYMSLALGAMALFIGGMWVANQGGFASQEPDKFFGSIYQVVNSMFHLGAMGLGAAGMGIFIRERLIPGSKHRLTVQFTSGVVALLLLDWLLACFGLLNAWTAWSACSLGTAVLTYHVGDPQVRNRWHPDNWPSPPWTLLLALPCAGLLIVACTCPPGTLWPMEGFGYDVTSYHMQLPNEWMQRGQMVSLKHNVYSHLPNLAEAGYMQLSIMRGHPFHALYTTQLFHACMALLAAANIASFIADRGDKESRVGGVLGGSLLLALPWTIVTGSLAYNEMFVLAFTSCALLILFENRSTSESQMSTDDQSTGAASYYKRIALVGFICGGAIMAKLTAGPMIALPIGLIVLTGWHHRAGSNKSNLVTRIKWASLFAAIVILVLVPFFIRNTIWTGNPVFPFATGIFGTGHWTEDLVQRWHAAHGARSLGQGLTDLSKQLFNNTGFGAVSGMAPDDMQATDAARFSSENGAPMLWTIVLVSTGILWFTRSARRLVGCMLILLGCQILFWLFATHHQSRFLIPTLIPACILAGMGFDYIRVQTKTKYVWLFPLVSTGVVLLLTATSFNVLFQSTPTIFAQTESGQPDRVQIPPFMLVDSLVEPGDATANQPGRFAGRHPINQLPETARVLLINHGGPLVYINRNITYNSAFDASALGQLIEKHKGKAAHITVDLMKQGYTHAWFDRGDYRRLVNSYGFDARVTESFLDDTLSPLWRHLETGNRSQHLFQLRLKVKLKPKTQNEENLNTKSNQQPQTSSQLQKDQDKTPTK